MNKIRLIFAAVMCFVTMTAVAQAPSDYSTVNNNKTTERNNATWYTIKNAKTGEYLRYEGFKFSMTTSPKTVDGVYALDTCAMFYLTGNANAAYIHNYAAGTQRLCVAPNKWDESGTAFQIKTTTGGVFISQSGNTAASDAFHDNESTGKVDLYLGSDPNSVWVFEKITDFGPIMGLDKMIDEAFNAVDAAEGWGNGFFSGLKEAYYKENLKDGGGGWGAGLLYWGTSIDKRDHSSLSQTISDIAEVQKILDEYTSGYKKVFNYAEIHNVDFSKNGVTKWISTNSTSLTVNTTQTTHTNVWKIINVEGETFSFYNEATNMYMCAPTVADGLTAVKMTSDKNQAGVYKINIINATTSGSGDNTTMVSATVNLESIDKKGMYIALMSADTKNVTAVTSSSAAGVQWIMTPIADVTIQHNFYSLAANMAWQYPFYLQENEGLVQDICEKYTSNHPSDDEESTTCNLADGIYTTCFTSDENDNSEEHWLQAELDTPASNFYFYIKANLRRADARPTKITVSGSNDGVSFTKIGETIETGLDDALYFSSDEIKCGTTYKYLRFTVNEVNEGGKAFSISEFYIMPVSDDVEHCVGTIKKFYTTAMYDEALRVPASDLIALESQYYLDKNTVAGGEVAASSATPQPGQYRYDKYTALQSALNTYRLQTTDADKYTHGKLLATALEEFKNSICSPLFVISSAWEDSYCKGWGVNCDPQNDEFGAVESNSWDLRQWFGVLGYKSTEMTSLNSIQLRSAINSVRLMNAQHSSIEEIEEWNTLYDSEREAYGIRLYNAPDYLSVDEYMDFGVVHERPTTSSNRNAAWYFTYVGVSSQIYGINAEDPEHMAFIEALAAFGEMYKTAKFYNDNYDATATKLGKYHYDNKGVNTLQKSGSDQAFDEQFVTATTHYNKGAAKIVEEYLAGGSVYTADVINSFVTAIKAHFPNFHLNNPPVGYYYRLRGRYSRNYLLSDIDNGTLSMGALTDGAGNVDDDVAAKSILFASLGSDEGTANIFAFGPGRYLKLNGTNIVYDRIPLADEAGTTYRSQDIYVGTSRTSTEGYFSLAFGSQNSNYLYDGVTKATVASTAASNKFDWEVEVVRELPVPITAAKMATLYVPFELVIPEGVIAYVLYGEAVTGNGTHYDPSADKMIDPDKNVFALRRIQGGIIPAGTPVILQGEAKTYYFPINYVPTLSDEEAKATYCYDGEIENMLQGSHMTTYIQEQTGITHYILSKKNDVVGMYKVRTYSSLTTSDDITTTFDAGKESFQNNGHRAWLPMSNSKSLGAAGYLFSLSMDGDETTGVEHLKPENGEVEGIYDLQGRKLESVKERGIYIMDGKRVFIK